MAGAFSSAFSSAFDIRADASSTVTLDGVTSSAAAAAEALAQTSVVLDGVTATSSAQSSVSAGSAVTLDGVIPTASAAVSGVFAALTRALEGVTLTARALINWKPLTGARFAAPENERPGVARHVRPGVPTATRAASNQPVRMNRQAPIRR